MIEGGASWMTEINDNIRDTPVGVLCLTKENLSRPWVLFEAGAMARGLLSQRVIPLLIDITPDDLKGPLQQFNGVKADQAGIRKLVATVNSATGAAALSSDVLDRVFQQMWPVFHDGFQRALEEYPEAPAAGTAIPEENRLDQIIDLLQGISARVKRLEDQPPERSTNAALFASPSGLTVGEVLAMTNGKKPPTQYVGSPPSTIERVLAEMNARANGTHQVLPEWVEASLKKGE